MPENKPELIELKAFRDGYNTLIKEFARLYYEDGYVESTLDEGDIFMHPVGISDDWWSIEDIFTAMRFRMSKDIVHKWYEYAYEQYSKYQKIDMNFYNYYLNNK